MKKSKILLGEDNNLVAMAVNRLFKGKISQLDMVRNTRELIKKYWVMHYDFILLNTWFQDSLKIAQAIRAHEARLKKRSTPIIGIFVDSREDEAYLSAEYQKYYDAGMNELFRIPLTTENIDKMLKKYCPSSRQQLSTASPLTAKGDTPKNVPDAVIGLAGG